MKHPIVGIHLISLWAHHPGRWIIHHDHYILTSCGNHCHHTYHPLSYIRENPSHNPLTHANGGPQECGHSHVYGWVPQSGHTHLNDGPLLQ